MVSCEDVLLDCQWLNKPIPCEEVFELVLTDEGFCCAFNAIQSGLSWKNGLIQETP